MFEILTAHTLQKASVLQRAIFHADRSNHCPRYGRFSIFKMAAVGHLGFLTFRNFNHPYMPFGGQKCIIVPNFVQIGQGIAEIWPFSIFQDGGRPPSWICSRLVWTTHEVYFGGLYHCAKFGWNRCSSFENPRLWTAAIFKNRKLPYLSDALTDLHKIWHDDVFWTSEGHGQLKFRNYKIQYGGRPPS